MPLIRLSLRPGRTPAVKAAIVDSIFQSLKEAFDVPDKDLFAVIHEHAEADFIFDRTYMGFDRSDDLVIIQVVAANTRGVKQKKALYAAIKDRLVEQNGFRPDDIFIGLVDVPRENWSFGGGIAQYV